jgi:ATP-dependent DNA ligase
MLRSKPELMSADRPSPIKAKLVDALPAEPGWQYEPKWDGFRTLVFRDGEVVDILSKSGKPLGRYFPGIVALVASVPQERFVLDGEIILPIADILSFDALQARLHPAQSRIDRLAKETPAQLMLFYCLGFDDTDFSSAPLSARRKRWRRCMT